MPVVDGVVIPEQPRILFERGAFHPVPTIIGFTRDEGWGNFVTRSFPMENADNEATDHPLATKAALLPADVSDETFLISSQTQAGEMHRFLADRIGPAATLTGDTPAAWNDPTKGGEIAKTQIDQGADVIYAAAGGTYQTIRGVPCWPEVVHSKSGVVGVLPLSGSLAPVISMSASPVTPVERSDRR